MVTYLIKIQNIKGKHMKKSMKFMAAALTLTLFIGCKSDPKSDIQKVSYAIGQQIGSNIKMQGIDVDVKMIAQGIEEAIKGDKARMTPEEMQKAMMDMQKKRMEDRKKEGVANLETGKKFLEENKSKEGIKVTESGLQYRVMTEGKGKKTQKDSKVKVHYKGTLIDGTEFDSSYKRKEPAEFPINGVIKGWQEALSLMSEGDKWELFVPSELAYGEMGRPNIPPNSVLVFEVELLEILKK